MMYNNFGYPGHYQSFGFGGGALVGMTILGILFAVLLIIVVVLKGFALWHAAKRSEKWWFIALLIINTMGLLELIYLIFVAKVWFRGCCKKKCCVEDKTEEKLKTDN